MKFQYLSGIGYSLYAMGGLEVGMSIMNRLILLTSEDDFDTMKSNLFCNSKESLSQAS